MKTDFVQVAFQVDKTLNGPLIAILAESGFSAFEEHEGGLFAYIESPSFDMPQLTEALASLPEAPIPFSTEKIPSKNWNAEWEANYSPVYIDGFCQIVPSFHAPSQIIPITLGSIPKCLSEPGIMKLHD